MWIQKFAEYLVPLRTVTASWYVRSSVLKGSSDMTDGHTTADPLRGVTEMFSRVKRVSPPSSTAERYRKNVYNRGPHAEKRGEFCARGAAFFFPRAGRGSAAGGSRRRTHGIHTGTAARWRDDAVPGRGARGKTGLPCI